jgi:hypothetical protein
MKVKSILMLLVLAGCSKAAEVGCQVSPISDSSDTVDMAAEVTQAADIAQPVSPSEDSTATEN